jgi:hypothetical protein
MGSEVARTFVNRARAAFRFLEICHGFAVADVTERSVTYRSAETFVTLGREPSSGEVAARIGLVLLDPACTGGYAIQDVMKVQGIPREGTYPDLYANDVRTLESVLEQLGRWVSQCGGPALRGDRALFLRLSELTTLRMRRYTNPVKTEAQMRAQIREAWGVGDYIRVAQLYSWLDEGGLSPDEREQREFARRIFLEGTG